MTEVGLSESAEGVRGLGDGVGVGEAVPVVSLVTKTSPQKIDGSPLKTASKAPGVVGKSAERVPPVT